jgi:hypothetical protein
MSAVESESRQPTTTKASDTTSPRRTKQLLQHTEGEDDALITTRVVVKSVLVIGLTGSGKTALLNSVVNNENKIDDDRVRLAPRAVTQHIVKYQSVALEREGQQYTFNLYDTRGVGDPEMPVARIQEEWTIFVTKELAQLYKIVFVFKPDRIRSQYSNEILKTFQYFKDAGAVSDNFIIVLSHFEFYKPEVIQSFYNELLNDAEVGDIFDFCKTWIATGCPKTSDWKPLPGLHEAALASTRSSRSLFVTAILENSPKVDLRQRIFGVREKEYQEQQIEATLKQLEEAKIEAAQRVEELRQHMERAMVETEMKAKVAEEQKTAAYRKELDAAQKATAAQIGLVEKKRAELTIAEDQKRKAEDDLKREQEKQKGENSCSIQ